MRGGGNVQGMAENFFYLYCYLSHQAGPTRLVVSRGVSDLVPVHWRCPREVVLCHV